MSIFSFLPILSKFQAGESLACEFLQEGLQVAADLTPDETHKQTLITLGAKLSQDQQFANVALSSLGKVLGDIGGLFQARSTSPSSIITQSTSNASKNATNDSGDSSSIPDNSSSNSSVSTKLVECTVSPT